MKVLSWDVGIKNLSFCLIKIENNKWEINDWGIINLIEPENDKCLNCCKKPSLFLPCDNSKFCKIHSKKHLIEIKDFDNFFNKCHDKKPCCYLSKDKECSKNSYFSHDENKNYCTSHAKTIYKKYVTSKKFIPIKKINASIESIDVLRKKLVEELDKRKHFLKSTFILIENQPTLKNPKMKAISSTIYDYFLIRGIIDKEINNSEITTVKYISPSNKLKIADEGDTTKLIKLKGDDTKTYKLTKSLGIKYCLKLIEGMDEWIKVFNSYKKKDDMADSFLQGMYYIFTNILI